MSATDPGSAESAASPPPPSPPSPPGPASSKPPPITTIDNKDEPPHPDAASPSVAAAEPGGNDHTSQQQQTQKRPCDGGGGGEESTPQKKAKLGDSGEDDAEARRLARQAKKQEERETFFRRCGEDPKIVIDCGFTDKLSEKEIKSLVQQLMYCYGANKRTKRPSYLYFTSLTPEVTTRLQKIPGASDWLGVVQDARPYSELFAKDELVYLTSDSPNELVKFDPTKAYIIGGIVDRNRLKGATFEKAKSQDIATAKLPIHRYITLKSSTVLAVNHVVDIIHAFGETENWEEALRRALPDRKKVEAPKTDGEKREGGGAGGEAEGVKTK